MKEILWPRKKIIILLLIILVYLVFGSIIYFLAEAQVISRLPPSQVSEETGDYKLSFKNLSNFPDLEIAKSFVNKNLVKENGHIDLYFSINETLNDRRTNSEALSYYLLWTAQERDKENFDNALNFIEEKMLHPQEGYLMWRLEQNDRVITDGANLASDADLRAIRALLIAEQQWGDERYSSRIDSLTQTLEKMAITQNKLFAPYAGISGTEIWKTQEVWLSYADFLVFRELANRRGQPWLSVYSNMKEEVLRSQIHNGLYNAGIDKEGKIINLDGDQYSVNSLWVMVRSAESGDVDLRRSADKALTFYKNAYQRDKIIYSGYRSNSSPASDLDSPWVYALVGRAAVALGDKDFTADIMKELDKKQIKNETSKYYGAFPESAEGGERVGQFTMQESIITLQDFETKFLVKNR